MSKHPTVPPFFLSFPLPFQRSSDSNSPYYLWLDDLYRSSDLGEPRPSSSLCCESFKLFRIPNTHKAIIAYQARLNILVNVTATLCCYSIEVEGSHFAFLWVTSLLKVASEVLSSTWMLVRDWKCLAIVPLISSEWGNIGAYSVRMYMKLHTEILKKFVLVYIITGISKVSLKISRDLGMSEKAWKQVMTSQ